MQTKDITDLMVLNAYIKAKQIRESEAASNTRPYTWPEDVLYDQTRAPWKVILRAMERVHDKGLIEYGVSLRAGWITDKGKDFLTEQA